MPSGAPSGARKFFYFFPYLSSFLKGCQGVPAIKKYIKREYYKDKVNANLPLAPPGTTYVLPANDTKIVVPGGASRRHHHTYKELQEYAQS